MVCVTRASWLCAEHGQGVACEQLCLMCDLCLQMQVFSSDPRAVLVMQRLEVRGGDYGPDPGVRA